MTPLETPEQARTRLEQTALSEHERARLWRRVAESAEGAPARRAVRAVAFGIPVLAGAAWLLFALRSEAPQSPPVADACALDAQAHDLALPSHCGERALRVDGDEWQLTAGARVARTDEGARVQQGRVRFSVRKRATGQFRVRVSDGEVRVIGTVFEVEEHAGRGSVTVSEGVIEFVWNDGARERVSAGETLHWPRRRAPPPAETARTPDAGGPRPSADLDRALDRLLQLRSQQRFTEAVVLLRRTLSEPGLAARQRERISYELGLALEADGQPSCPHWRRHIERFGRARHTAALTERSARCRN